jgi:23S rRNA pseudouridine955/2504/2580 synthase/23S rRNA pseudouridine1911/1915/1917 synthase
MSKHANKPETIFENEDFIVINKPSGMLSIPDRVQSETSLKDILVDKYGEIFTVHRLDKETSGVIVFAKNEQTHKKLSELFEGREVKKYYVGLVHGKLQNEEGTINAPIMEHPSKKGRMITHAKGKPSETDYEVIENFRLYCFVKFQIHTGRTHQIRVHMQHIGHSIVCDELYGSNEPVYISLLKRNYHLSKKEEAEKPILSRLALHSSQLKFDLNGEHYEFGAEIPKDLKATLQQLRKWNSE